MVVAYHCSDTRCCLVFFAYLCRRMDQTVHGDYFELAPVAWAPVLSITTQLLSPLSQVTTNLNQFHQDDRTADEAAHSPIDCSLLNFLFFILCLDIHQCYVLTSCETNLKPHFHRKNCNKSL